ncbi:MAG TPA: coniferyl aldehyde dehydrogenase [Candidatus Limnocylindrales bacterium]|nr:coniferyl aldehyde dehydrogenase [Candidatus Limnocylindrales bacterium]
MAQTAQLRVIHSAENECERIYKIQREAYLRHPYPTAEERRANLSKLEQILAANVDQIAAMIGKDFGHRCAEETKLLEIFTSIDGIRDARKKVGKWMAPERRHVSILFATGKNRVIPQPKGVVGIVVPWNYPLFLLMGPLTSALAAGNRCMVKMAANSTNLCKFLAGKFAEVFPEDTVAILPGVKGSDFSSLPFDHLLFTGSADAGRNVMRAAAENLTPVTLELGGKSPTVVCEDFDVETAASRILYAKYVNAGQTCLAPDYVMVPKDKRDKFVEACKRILPQRYPDTSDPSYTSLIDDKAYKRLRATLDDAVAKGAEVVPLVPGAQFDDKLRKFPPHLVLNPTEDMMVMREEIFGPLLPVKTYDHLDDVLRYVNSKDRPLGFYLFTNDKEREEKLIYGTISGGVTVNNCVMHVAQHDMPFGGVGSSGMGHYHAREGFVEMSKLRPVHTNPKLPGVEQFYPPYGRKHSLLFNMLLRFKR